MRAYTPVGHIDLIRTYDPRYDTLTLNPSRNGKVVDENLFIVPLGKDHRTGKERHHTDTNMTCASCLGSPLHAEFSWMSVALEGFDNAEDVDWLRHHCTFRMVMGGDTTIRSLNLNAMSPRLPKGGEILIQEWIKDGVIKVWPWFIALLPNLKVQPTEMFRVQVTSDEVSSLNSPLRIKVFLGPWLYRQKLHGPTMEESPKTPVDPE